MAETATTKSIPELYLKFFICGHCNTNKFGKTKAGPHLKFGTAKVFNLGWD